MLLPGEMNDPILKCPSLDNSSTRKDAVPEKHISEKLGSNKASYLFKYINQSNKNAE
jgi:hypothetical protein